jgi:hypothetical protein
MRCDSWLIVAFGVLVLLVAARFFPEIGVVQSGGRFDDHHKDALCTDCHTLRAEVSGGSVAALVFREECERCHTAELSNATGIPLTFHASRDKGCSACHSFHNTEEIDAAGHQFLVSFENSYQRGQCYSCHGPSQHTDRLSPGHRYATRIYHSDFRILGRLSPSQTCLICHSETAATDSNLLDDHARRAPRFSEHGSHPVGVRVIPGKGEPGNKICSEIDSRIQLFSGRIECQTCHSLSSEKQFRLIALQPREALCRACHRID